MTAPAIIPKAPITTHDYLEARARAPATSAPTKPTGTLLPPGAPATTSPHSTQPPKPSLSSSPISPNKPATLRRKLAAIAIMHRATGHESPTDHGMVRTTLAGIRRERCIAPTQKAALLVEHLRTALATCGERPIDLRDRALLLLGFAGALRRSELVGLDLADLRFEPDGLILRLRRSKTNQEGDLEEVPILPGADPTTCPVEGLRHWLAVADLEEGPVFRGVDRAGRIGRGRLTARIVAE